MYTIDMEMHDERSQTSDPCIGSLLSVSSDSDVSEERYAQYTPP
jgi:hypothetical protein